MALSSQKASALDKGDWLFRFGVVSVSPNDDSGTVTGIPGSAVGVDSDTGVGITFVYMLRQNVGIEVLGALPFKHDITGAGTIAGLGKIAKTKQLPPTVSLQYHFSPTSNVRPYVGIGLNYTFFFDEETTASLNGALGGPTNIKLDDSWGLALSGGVDIDINRQWYFNASVWNMDIGTTATLDTGGTVRQVDVNIDPWAVFLGVGLRF
jgi:outer membrane protein